MDKLRIVESSEEWETISSEVVVGQIDFTNERASLSLKDTSNNCYSTDISQFVFVYVKFGIAKIKDGKTWMILNDVLNIMGMLLPIQLVVSHSQRDQPIVLLDTVYDAPEISLKLVVREIDLQKVVVCLEDFLTDDKG